MNIQSVTSSNTSAGSQNASQTSTAPDYQSFLTLLVEQMKNQDPTNPASSTEMLSQLASFSTVEQQTVTNTKLDAIAESMAVLQSANLVGMTATTVDGSVTGQIQAIYWESGTPIALLGDGTNIAVTSDVILSR